MNVTVPVGVGLLGLTVAVKVIASPTTALRASAEEDVIVILTFGFLPIAKKLPPLSV